MGRHRRISSNEYLQVHSWAELSVGHAPPPRPMKIFEEWTCHLWTVDGLLVWLDMHYCLTCLLLATSRTISWSGSPEDKMTTAHTEEGPRWLLPLLSAHFFRCSHTAPSTPRIREETCWLMFVNLPNRPPLDFPSSFATGYTPLGRNRED
jgi:hypothetical protein